MKNSHQGKKNYTPLFMNPPDDILINENRIKMEGIKKNIRRVVLK